jgi:hypothetical protein
MADTDDTEVVYELTDWAPWEVDQLQATLIRLAIPFALRDNQLVIDRHDAARVNDVVATIGRHRHDADDEPDGAPTPPPQYRAWRPPTAALVVIGVLAVLVALAMIVEAVSSEKDKPSTPTSTQTTCQQVRASPSLHPSDWRRLVNSSARGQGKNEAELWAYFQRQIAQDCPELLIRVTG